MADILQFPDFLSIEDIGPQPIPVCRNGPALWETLLESLGEDSAVVAGGCIRDYLLGLEPKDIDIFVPLGSREELQELCDRMNGTTAWSVNIIEATEYEEGSIHDVIGVIEGEALGLPVNIIAREAHADACAWDLINSFDFGILQWAFYSTDQAIVSTCQAFMDLALRNATLTNNRSHEQSLERFARWSERNPRTGVLLVDPYA